MGRPGGQPKSTYGESGKPRIGNVEYDFVTHIDVNGEQQVPLGFNKDDDPKQVALEWCVLHSVDRDMIPRIMAHIKPMQDPQARAERVAKEKLAASKLLVHIPNYVKCFLIYVAPFFSQLKRV